MRLRLAMSEVSEKPDLIQKAGHRIGDTSELPEILKKQLASSKVGELEEKILSTIRTRFDGVASIDEIMVGLYRDFKYITEDRRMLASKIYRMSKSGLLESVPKRRGIVQIKSHSNTSF
jgi:hypothetical protein